MPRAVSGTLLFFLCFVMYAIGAFVEYNFNSITFPPPQAPLFVDGQFCSRYGVNFALCYVGDSRHPEVEVTSEGRLRAALRSQRLSEYLSTRAHHVHALPSQVTLTVPTPGVTLPEKEIQ